MSCNIRGWIQDQWKNAEETTKMVHEIITENLDIDSEEFEYEQHKTQGLPLTETPTAENNKQKKQRP